MRAGRPKTQPPCDLKVATPEKPFRVVALRRQTGLLPKCSKTCGWQLPFLPLSRNGGGPGEEMYHICLIESPKLGYMPPCSICRRCILRHEPSVFGVGSNYILGLGKN